MELSNYQAFMECMRKWEKIGCNILCGLALWEQMQDCDRRGVPYTDIDIEAVSQDVAYRLMMSHDRLYALALYEWTEQGLLNGGGFLLDPNTFTLYAGKKSYVLPQNEGKILLTLLKSSPNLVSKSDLFHVLWGTAEFIDENALQVNFTRLRKTLREVGLGDRIETVRGQGYRLKERVEI